MNLSHGRKIRILAAGPLLLAAGWFARLVLVSPVIRSRPTIRSCSRGAVSRRAAGHRHG